MAAFDKSVVKRTVLGTELNTFMNPKEGIEEASWEVLTV